MASHILPSRIDSSQSLSAYFDETFLPDHLGDPAPDKLKLYRNALGRASQC